MQPKQSPTVVHLFAEERTLLLSLLASLDAGGWAAPTVCAGWTVKDLAAHLLGDDLGALSIGRDDYAGGLIRAVGWDELVIAINQHNEAWVAAQRRLSPRVLIELLTDSGRHVQDYFAALDPAAPGPVVSWAGPDPAPMVLHIAREYTERWMHQEQIREAVGAPGLRDRRLFHPVLDTFVHALPHTYRDTFAPVGTHVRLTITGDSGGAWSLLRESEGWALATGVEAEPTTSITTDEDTAWRIFTRGIDHEAPRNRSRWDGDPALGVPFLQAVAIIA